MRRISTGVQGRPLLGNLTVENNTILPVTESDDLLLHSLSSTGRTLVSTELLIRDGNSLSFSSIGAAGFVNLKAPSSTTGNATIELTLPPDTGSAGDVLTVDGSGNLSFQDITIEVSNQTADSRDYYPLMSRSDSGSINSVDVSSGKLYFTPNNGTLYADRFDGEFIGDGSNLTNVTAGTVSISQNSSTNSDFFPTFVSSTSGNRDIITDSSMTYNPNSGEFTAEIVTASSDAALKEDIVPLSNALDKVLELSGMKYKRKRTGQSEVGLVAQDVEKIMPEVVYTGSNGLKSVAYGNIIAYLIEAIKEQAREINSLKGQ